MISKAKLKELAAYKQAKVCDIENVFVIEGDKMVQEALASGIQIKTLCAIEDWYMKNRTLIRRATLSDSVFEITSTELERISGLKTPNQVWLLAERIQSYAIENSYVGLTLVLDKIQDPGNLGTILRIADWFNIRHIICSKDTVSVFNPKVVQSTMGAIFRVQVHYCDLIEYLDNYPKSKPIYGAALSGDSVYTIELIQDSILIIGNESKGISPEIEKKITHKLRIPNIGHSCESLNASVATGILCSEFRRRN